jgi:hippurate hydrolase
MIFWIGTIDRQRIEDAKAKRAELPGLHSALYHPEPRGSVSTGVRAMVAAVSGLLPPKTRP